MNATRTMAAQGRIIVSITPVANYEQAMQLKNRLAARYPNALVIP